MEIAAATSLPVTRRRIAIGIGAALIGAGILLPVEGAARWLDATYNATAEDVSRGVWLLKLALIALGAATFAIRQLPARAAQHSAATVEGTSALFPVVLALLVLGTALRVNQLGTELWMDEIFLLVRYVPLDFNQLLATYDSQNHQPLYSILAKLAFHASGGTDWSIRIPAVLMGVAALWALWWFARRVTTESEAILSVALLTVSYHHVWFSQNARGYTAMLLLTLLATGLIRRLCEGSASPRLVWGYAILVALATYTHLTAALIAVGHAAAVLLSTNWRSRQAREQAAWPLSAIGMSALVTVALYAPMLPQVWRKISAPTMGGVEVEWTGATWMLREGLRVLSQGIPGGLLTVALAVVVLTIGIVSYWRQSRLTALLMFAPIVVTLGTILAARHNLWPRFFFFAAGFMVLAAMRGGFTLVRTFVPWRPELVAVAGASAVALLSLVTVPRAWQPKQQFKAAYEFVERERRAGDEVLVLDIASEVYLLRRWAPTWHRLTSMDLLRETERSASRTWIVYTLPARIRALTPELYRYLTPPRYQDIRVFPASVGGAEIHIVRHDPATGHD